MKDISSYPEVNKKAKDNANTVKLERLTPGSIFCTLSTNAIYTVINIPEKMLISEFLSSEMVFAVHIYTGELTIFSKEDKVEPRFFELK